VVYLRLIFHPDGFTFPLQLFWLDPLAKDVLLTEIGREAATIVLILTAARLFGRNLHERLAYFLTIFAIWDIFYYVWLKVLLNWPATIMDWDILFLIPLLWAAPVLYPILISLAMLVFAVVILHCGSCGKALKPTFAAWLGFIIAAVIMVTSFCIAGAHATEPDFERYFYWPVFAVGYLLAIGVFAKCAITRRQEG
jgi:hypothetical protein